MIRKLCKMTANKHFTGVLCARMCHKEKHFMSNSLGFTADQRSIHTDSGFFLMFKLCEIFQETGT